MAKNITYEQIYAGALLKFESIDFVDRNFLINDIENKSEERIQGLWYKVVNIGNYVKHSEIKGGLISLREGFTLDSYIEELGCTLRQHLSNVQGEFVKEYFDNFDVENYLENRKKNFIDTKEKVFNNANILLISDDVRDNEGMVNYGFKNIDYFKSIIRANEYFEKNPEELNKFHIILKGNQNVQGSSFESRVPLENKFDELQGKENKFVSRLSRYDYNDHTNYHMYILDRDEHHSFGLQLSSYDEIFDKLIEDCYINNLLEKTKVSNKKFVPHEDYVNPNKLPLPTKKKDLKILYLDPIRVSIHAKKAAKELGLNVEFKEDNNSALGKEVKSNLGNYDIIIASDMYSFNLVNMNKESTEQCKDTGRELTLLLVKRDNLLVDQELGKGLRIYYSYGGELAPNTNYTCKEFDILRENIDLDELYYKNLKTDQDEYSVIKAVLQSAVALYNQRLKEITNGLDDFDFKSAEEFDEEFKIAKEEKTRKRIEEMAPINDFNHFRYVVEKYIENKNNGLIKKEPEGLKITETEKGFRVDNICQGRIICSIIYTKSNKKNIIFMDIQTINNKGYLSPPETVSLYTSKDANYENLAPKPNEKQLAAIASIENKVNTYLEPINDKVQEQIENQEKIEEAKETVKRKVFNRFKNKRKKGNK